MFSGNGVRPAGHPERCVQIRGQRGSDEGGGKKRLKVFFTGNIKGDPGRERRPVGRDEAQAYCRRQPERHSEAEGH